ERGGDDNRESCLRFAKILKLAAKFERVAFRQFDMLLHFCVSFADPAFYIATLQVHHQRCPSLSGVPQDRCHSFDPLNIGEAAEWQKTGLSNANRQSAHRFQLFSIGIREPDDNVKASIPFEHRSNRLPTQCSGNGLVHVGGVEVVFCQRVAFHFDFQHRSASCGLIFNFAFALTSARNLLEHFLYFGSESLQHVIVVSEVLDCDVSTNAFEHFVKAHFNRLRDHHASTGVQRFNFSGDDSRQFLPADEPTTELSPLVLRFVVDVEIAVARRHWIGCNLRAADSREHVRNLGHTLPDFFLGLALVCDALSDVHAARPENHYGERPLIELRNKIGTEMAEDEHCQCEKSNCAEHNQPTQSQSP